MPATQQTSAFLEYAPIVISGLAFLVSVYSACVATATFRRQTQRDRREVVANLGWGSRDEFLLRITNVGFREINISQVQMARLLQLRWRSKWEAVDWSELFAYAAKDLLPKALRPSDELVVNMGANMHELLLFDSRVQRVRITVVDATNKEYRLDIPWAGPTPTKNKQKYSEKESFEI